MDARKSPILYVLLVLVVVILVNIIFNRFNLRFDFTQDNRYTLSKATKDLLKNLEEPVTVKAYFTSEGLPPQYLQVKRDLKDLLIEYNKISNGDLVYEFMDPTSNPELEQEAMQNGIQPVIVQVREKDQLKQQKAYMGAVITMGKQKEVIPFFQNNAEMEYMLTTSVKKVSVENKPLVGLITGHGEPALSMLSQASFELDVLYKVESVDLSTNPDLSKYKALAIIAPKDTIPVYQLGMLDQYLAKGGKLFAGINRVGHDFNTSQASLQQTGLETWLASKGILIEDNMVADAQCINVTVRQQRGPFTMNVPVPFPYIPRISNFADHPITKGMEMLVLPIASNMVYSGGTGFTFTPLLTTSERSSVISAPTYFDVNKTWQDSDFPLSKLTVAGILTGKFGGNVETSIIVVSDGDFVINGEGQQAQQLQPDNISLFVNSIDWLSDDTGLISLRTKGITARPLDELEDGRKQLLKWLNFLLPILLILGYGFYRIQRAKNRRMRRIVPGQL
ncbi:MAG: Gldg family protein [Bacteroidales bacterium]|nr:Gldg family protein [Bacteroidales bacterium]